MRIERVSKYVPITTPSRSHDASTVRQMLVSIPRVKWLEKDLSECKYYNRYKSMPEVVKTPLVDAAKTPSWAARLKGTPLSQQEEKVAEMMNRMRIIDISRSLNIAQTTVRGIIARVKAKRGGM